MRVIKLPKVTEQKPREAKAEASGAWLQTLFSFIECFLRMMLATHSQIGHVLSF